MGSLVLFPQRGKTVPQEPMPALSFADAMAQMASVKRFESLAHLKTRLELLVSEAIASGDYKLVKTVEDWLGKFELEVIDKRQTMSREREAKGLDW